MLPPPYGGALCIMAVVCLSVCPSVCLCPVPALKSRTEGHRKLKIGRKEACDPIKRAKDQRSRSLGLHHPSCNLSNYFYNSDSFLNWTCGKLFHNFSSATYNSETVLGFGVRFQNSFMRRSSDMISPWYSNLESY